MNIVKISYVALLLISLLIFSTNAFSCEYGKINTKEDVIGCVQKAKKGDANAQYLVGALLYRDKSYAEAIKYLKKSVAQGNSDAQLLLGIMYYEGKAVNKDINKGIKLITKAAKQGNIKAQVAIAGEYSKGDILEKDYEKSYKWGIKAARQGNVESQRLVGMLYAYGMGVAQDKEKAKWWLKKAAQKGDERSKKELNKLQKESNSNTKTASPANKNKGSNMTLYNIVMNAAGVIGGAVIPSSIAALFIGFILKFMKFGVNIRLSIYIFLGVLFSFYYDNTLEMLLAGNSLHVSVFIFSFTILFIVTRLIIGLVDFIYSLRKKAEVKDKSSYNSENENKTK